MRPTMVDEYVRELAAEARPHFERVDAVLRGAVPDAERVLKWGHPHYVAPRFLFSVSAFKAHLGLLVSPQARAPFAAELAGHDVSPMGVLRLRYAHDLPEGLVRQMAEEQVRVVSRCEDDAYWGW